MWSWVTYVQFIERKKHVSGAFGGWGHLVMKLWAVKDGQSKKFLLSQINLIYANNTFWNIKFPLSINIDENSSSLHPIFMVIAIVCIELATYFAKPMKLIFKFRKLTPNYKTFFLKFWTICFYSVKNKIFTFTGLKESWSPHLYK